MIQIARMMTMTRKRKTTLILLTKIMMRRWFMYSINIIISNSNNNNKTMMRMRTKMSSFNKKRNWNNMKSIKEDSSSSNNRDKHQTINNNNSNTDISISTSILASIDQMEELVILRLISIKLTRVLIGTVEVDRATLPQLILLMSMWIKVKAMLINISIIMARMLIELVLINHKITDLLIIKAIHTSNSINTLTIILINSNKDQISMFASTILGRVTCHRCLTCLPCQIWIFLGLIHL